LTDLTFDMEPDFKRLYESCRNETMTSLERMHALWAAVRHIHKSGIHGAIVECGVWRGGSMMLAARALLELGDASRELWLYDTYQGMTEPTVADVQAMTGQMAGSVLAGQPKDDENPFWALAQREVVERNMRATRYPEQLTHYVEGPVEQTLPRDMPDAIALLRLDTDWYESTRHELLHLWPRLAAGGILIIDDYGYWEGARKAVDEYFAALPDAPFLARIDFTGRIAIKR
jgi:O-methyltransferase